jgi:hypothetical protein
MDGAIKSKRLYPSYTVLELSEAIKHTSNDARRATFKLAIRQRDPASQDYIPHFSVPQL